MRAVEPAAFTKVSALGVEEQRVLIDLTSPPGQWQALGDGYRVGLHIVTLAQQVALQVPVSAVFPLPADAAPAAAVSAASGGAAGPRLTHAVFVADGRHARQVGVVLGGRNGSGAWIRSVLARGQQVIVYPPASVHEGVRIAARRV